VNILSRLGTSVLSTVAAFGTYFCVYGLRKPFTAASYDGQLFFGLDYKTTLVTAQVLGYTLSKFLGIAVVGGMAPEKRVKTLFLLMAVALAALVLFGLTPAPWNVFWLFVNGLPLGMVFGLVLGFLEGRKTTEALAAGLCASFILADGVAKSLGAELLARGIAERWMPAVAGGAAAVPFCFFALLLTRIPAPSTEDRALRQERIPLTAPQRGQLFWAWAPGLVLLMGTYLLLTLLRSVRADFAPELWKALGYSRQPGLFAQSETLVMAGVVVASGLWVVVRDNRRAFFGALGCCLLGFAMVGLALLGRGNGLGAFGFMVLIGLGLYLPYVAVHTTLFERLLAMAEQRGNVGYLLYLADSFGYLGYVGVMLGKSFWGRSGSYLSFFVTLAGLTAGLSTLLLLGSVAYFYNRTRGQRAPEVMV